MSNLILNLVVALWTIIYGKQLPDMFQDNAPTLGPHHWNPPITGSVSCIPTQSPTQMFCWNWCVSIDIRT